MDNINAFAEELLQNDAYYGKKTVMFTRASLAYYWTRGTNGDKDRVAIYQ